MELINAKISAAGVINESEIIKYILNEDINSLSKREMQKGRQYYNSQHDVLEKNFNERYIEETETTDGYEKEKRRVFKNPNRSNHHDVHSFHKLLVDQKVSYMVGKEPTISVKGAEDDSTSEEYEAFVADIADENFDEMLQKWVKGASNKGYEVLHFYYDDDGNLDYCIVPAEEIIPIYDSEYQKNLEEVIRYYTVSVIKNGQTYRRRKVEWWKKDGVIIGGAFGKIVSSVVADVIMPPLGLLIGGVNFTDLKWVMKPAEVVDGKEIAAVTLNYGNFLQATFDFLIIAFSIFMFIKLITKLTEKKKAETPAAPPAPPVLSKEEVLLTEIRDILKEK